MFIYYASICYVSIFCLTILDKFNKKEIENMEDLQGYLFLYLMGMLSKFYKAKRVTMKTYDKYFKIKDIVYLDSDEEDNDTFKCKLNIMLENDIKFFRLKIKNNKVNIFDKTLLDYLNSEKALFFIENKNQCKEMIGKDLLDNNLEELINFLKDELLTNLKLFLNIELTTGKLTEKKLYDITFEMQKYFVEGNTILSKNFLKNLVKMKFNEDLSDDYTVNIMNQDVEMFTLHSDNKIKIVAKEDENQKKRLTYDIIKNN